MRSCVLSFLISLGFVSLASAATLPRSLPNLNLRSSGTVQALALQPDGKVIVAGWFQQIGDLAATNLMRLDTDGSVDLGWNPGLSAPINDIAVSADGNVFVAMYFGPILKKPLSGTGASNQTFQFADRFDEMPRALAVEGGYLYVALDGADVRRYDANTGEHDAGWTCLVTGSRLVSDHAGHLYIDAARVNIADGSIDTTWSAPELTQGVTATALGSDGYFYVATYSASLNGGAEGLFRMRLDAHGAIDAAWHPVATGDVRSSRFYSIVPMGDGSVVVGGAFDRLGGLALANLVRLVGADGHADPMWTAQTDGEVDAVIRGSSNSLLVGGYYTSVANVPRASVARLAADGAADSQFTTGIYLPAHVRAIAPDSVHGTVYVGGRFDWVGTELHRNILRLDAQGNLDSAWTPGTDAPDDEPSRNGGVNAIAVTSSDVYIGGQFSMVNGVARNSIAKIGQAAPGVVAADWNPELRGSFFGADNATSSIGALSVDGQNRVYVGGDFQSVGGVVQLNLARLLTNGAPDTAWRPAPYYPITRFTFDGESHLYFIASHPSGFINTLGKVSLDSGTVDEVWAGPPRLQSAYDIGFSRMGDLYVIGGLGLGSANVLRVSPETGSIDFDWTPLTPCSIRRMAVDDDGVVYVGGSDPSSGPWVACVQRIGRDGVVDASFAPSWEDNTDIQALAIGTAGVVYAGGTFDSVGGLDRSGLAAFGAVDSTPSRHSTRPTLQSIRARGTDEAINAARSERKP